MPLLHQTSITGAGPDGVGDGGVEAGDESDAADGPMPMVKHGRKGHGHHGQDRGMMAFSRKKLKTKYMKSKAASKGGGVVVLDGVAGTMTNGGVASDGEK